MLSVNELSMNEFRGIKRTREPLKFTRFNVLIGRNNSGKSTVLYALYLLPEPSIEIQLNMQIPAAGRSKIGLIQHLTGGLSSLIYKYTGEAFLNFKLGGLNFYLSLDHTGHAEAFDGDKKS